MSNSYRGKIEAIEGIQSIQRQGKEPFEKRRLMLDVTRYDGLTGERGYEKHIIFEFSGKNVRVPDDFKVGDLVEVFFDVESYEGIKKDGTKDWFTSVRGYKIQSVTTQNNAPQGGVHGGSPFQQQAPANGVASFPPAQSSSPAPSGQSSDAPF